MEISARNVIIGSGITGAVLSNFFGKESILISPNIGGQAKDILFMMHCSKFVKKFLKKNKIDFCERTCLIGFYYRNKHEKTRFHDSCTDELRDEYYKKSRKFLLDDTDKTMEIVQPAFQYYDFDLKDFLSKTIFSKYFEDKVSEINIDQHFLFTKSGLKINYSYLFVTIPLIDFVELVTDDYSFLKKLKLEYSSKFVFSSHVDFNDFFMSGFDYVYCMEKDNPLLRVSRRNGAITNYEFSERVLVAENFKKIKYAYLAKEYEVNEAKTRLRKEFLVNLFGRFAEWDDELLSSDVVERCYQEL